MSTVHDLYHSLRARYLILKNARKYNIPICSVFFTNLCWNWFSKETDDIIWGNWKQRHFVAAMMCANEEHGPEEECFAVLRALRDTDRSKKRGFFYLDFKQYRYVIYVYTDKMGKGSMHLMGRYDRPGKR